MTFSCIYDAIVDYPIFWGVDPKGFGVMSFLLLFSSIWVIFQGSRTLGSGHSRFQHLNSCNSWWHFITRWWFQTIFGNFHPWHWGEMIQFHDFFSKRVETWKHHLRDPPFSATTPEAWCSASSAKLRVWFSPKSGRVFNQETHTPWKINMEPQHGGLEDDFPFQLV